MNKTHRNEKGSISITAALFTAVLFALIAAVISHAQFTNSYTRTREAAANTARAASQEINIDLYLTTGETEIDETQAAQTAYRHIANYPNLAITNLEITTNQVQVTVSETTKSITGVTKTITSDSSATPLQDR